MDPTLHTLPAALHRGMSIRSLPDSDAEGRTPWSRSRLTPPDLERLGRTFAATQLWLRGRTPEQPADHPASLDEADPGPAAAWEPP